MNIFCTNCGQPLTVGENEVGEELFCPACGAENRVTAASAGADGLIEPEGDRTLWRQERRRATLVVMLSVGLLVGGLAWLLFHPSGSASPARMVKNAIFGSRVAQAAEVAAQEWGQQGSGGAGQGGQQGSGGQAGAGQGGAGQSGSGQAGAGQGGAGQGGAGQAGAGQGGAGRGGAGRSSGTGQAAGRAGGGQMAGNSGSGGGGSSAEGGGRGTGRTRPGEQISETPANPQDPNQNFPELAAPPERSIGWLEKFFGLQTPAGGPIRPGEGGTHASAPGAGNTNESASASATPPPATDLTGTNSPDIVPITREEPPEPSARRETNRAAVTETVRLRDPIEEMLNQHHAGSGDVRISLMWSNINDLDLHVVDPRGEEIFYGHPTSGSGGLLDIDMNRGTPFHNPAVENVFWPTRGAPTGRYQVFVNHFRCNGPQRVTPFTVRILVRGRTQDIRGVVLEGEPKKLVHQFTVSAN